MLALLRFVENPRDRVEGFRLLHLLPGIGSATAQRVLDRMAEAADPIAALAGIPTPPRAGDDWAGFVETLGNLRYSEWPVDLERARLWHNRISTASTKTLTRGGLTCPARADRLRLSFARTIPD